MSARAWIAVAVIVVGGTMWAWLPSPAVRQGGPLKDVSASGIVWHVRPGRARAEWVLLTNAGTRPIRLSSARIGGPLRAHARVIGVMARHELKVSVGRRWPSPVRGLFSDVDGFVVGPGQGISIAFGLSLPYVARVPLPGAVIRYRVGDHDYERDVSATATLCVSRRRRCPR